MSDLVARLRDYSAHCTWNSPHVPVLAAEAADELERLTAQVDTLTRERDEAVNRADRLAAERDTLHRHWLSSVSVEFHQREVAKATAEAESRVVALEGLLRKCRVYVDTVRRGEGCQCEKCRSTERLLVRIDAALTPGAVTHVPPCPFASDSPRTEIVTDARGRVTGRRLLDTRGLADCHCAAITPRQP